MKWITENFKCVPFYRDSNGKKPNSYWLEKCYGTTSWKKAMEGYDQDAINWEDYLKNKNNAIAVIADNWLCIDIDSKSAIDQKEFLTEVAKRMNAIKERYEGKYYIEKTVSGGRHIWLRTKGTIDDIPRKGEGIDEGFARIDENTQKRLILWEFFHKNNSQKHTPVIIAPSFGGEVARTLGARLEDVEKLNDDEVLSFISALCGVVDIREKKENFPTSTNQELQEKVVNALSRWNKDLIMSTTGSGGEIGLVRKGGTGTAMYVFPNGSVYTYSSKIKRFPREKMVSAKEAAFFMHDRELFVACSSQPARPTSFDDSGLAEAFRKNYAFHDFVYQLIEGIEAKRWYVYDSVKWLFLPGTGIDKMILNYHDQIKKRIGIDDNNKPFKSTATKIKNVRSILEIVFSRSVRFNGYNGFPFQNGVYDIKKGEIIPYAKSMFFSQKVGYDVHEGKLDLSFLDKSEFGKFLKSTIVYPDKKTMDLQMITAVCAYIGYCCTNHTKHHKILMFYGQGRNGKGVFTGLLTHMFEKYSTSVGIQDLGKSEYLAANIEGVRLVLDSESEPSKGLLEGKFKAITAGDKQTVNKKYVQPYEIKPVSKMIWSLNGLPRGIKQIKSFFSRILIVPFHREFVGDDRDLNLESKLKSETGKIMKFCLDLYCDLKGEDNNALFDDPVQSLNIKEGYKQQLSTVAAFLELGCEEYGKDVAAYDKDMVYTWYTIFCENNGNTPKNMENFVEDVRWNYPEVLHNGTEGRIMFRATATDKHRHRKNSNDGYEN